MTGATLSAFFAGTGNKDRLRLWVRLLSATRFIGSDLREKLGTRFGSTLPRFNVMAALYRRPEGMPISDLSRFLLVSSSNITVIVNRLVADGLVVKSTREGDFRASIVRLTGHGAKRFREIAAEHENWVAELLDEVDDEGARRMTDTLQSLRRNRST